MGKAGSAVLLSGIYLATLILVTGLRPIHVVRQTIAGLGRLRPNCTNGDCIGNCEKPTSKASSKSAKRNWLNKAGSLRNG